MKIVSFSGIDGSGKTTQIKSFTNYLKARGLKYKVIHIVQNSIANKIAAFFSSKKRKNSKKESKKTESITKASPLSINLRKVALLIDLILFRLYLLFNLKRKMILVFDRYFIDYLVNIYFLEGRKKARISPLIKDLMPKPDLAFYLKVDHKTANQRKTDQGLNYLARKTSLFESVKENLNYIEIPPKKSKKAISKEIIDHFKKLN
ncbi:MAG: hypothetical protein GF347_02850 [Candidatus Moranbacteria bacterium]|nr:hypothetical protein [Candidatus Moranbacteria bacterium]